MTKQKHSIDKTNHPKGDIVEAGGGQLMWIHEFTQQLEDPDVNERLRAVGEIIASDDVLALPLLLNVLLKDDAFPHRAVEMALSKKGETEWLRLFHADDAEWVQLIESNHAILLVAIESRYVQQRIMGVLSKGKCALPEKLLIRYFAVLDKDYGAYEQALSLVEKHNGSVAFEAFKKKLHKLLNDARNVQITTYVNRAFETSPSSVRAEVAKALSQMGDVREVLGLIVSLNDLNIDVFKKVVESLISLHKESALKPLIHVMLTHAGPEFRAVAIQAMQHFSGKQVAVALKKSVAEDPSPENRAVATEVLRSYYEKDKKT